MSEDSLGCPIRGWGLGAARGISLIPSERSPFETEICPWPLGLFLFVLIGYLTPSHWHGSSLPSLCSLKNQKRRKRFSHVPSGQFWLLMTIRLEDLGLAPVGCWPTLEWTSVDGPRWSLLPLDGGLRLAFAPWSCYLHLAQSWELVRRQCDTCNRTGHFSSPQSGYCQRATWYLQGLP